MNVKIGAKGFRLNKDRITVHVCANKDVNQKLKRFMVGKLKEPRSFKNTVHLPAISDGQGNIWITAELFKNLFFNSFVPAIEENFRKQGFPEDIKAILLLHNFRAHPPPSGLVCGNIFATYLPANLTSSIQTMD